LGFGGQHRLAQADGMIAKSDIVRPKVTPDDVEPKVTRQCVVLLGIHLDRLHIVMQLANSQL
jgi:hypothetical protein